MKRSMSSPLNDSVDKQDHEELLKLSLSTDSRPLSMAASSPLMQTAHQPITLSQTHIPLFSQNLPSLVPLTTPLTPPSPPSHHYNILQKEIIAGSGPVAAGTSRQSRTRKSPVQKLKPGKSEKIPTPYPWATNRRATIHSLGYLLSHNINNISGQVQCRRCDQKYDIEYDLQQKFMEVSSFISENKYTMHDRAPAIWMNPNLPNCKHCHQSNCVKPILGKKKSINWLFLLLGQMLGCCKLSELKYLCKHTKNHRTGAKDRVLYLTYLGLCKQLDPDGPFDV